MPHVVPHRAASGAAVPNVFDRVATEGDAARFYAAETGYSHLVHVDTTDTLPNGDALVVPEGGTTYLFRLPFSYLVGARQLQALVPDAAALADDEMRFVEIPSADMRNQALLGWTGPSATTFTVYFEEVSSSAVRVYGLTDPPGVVWFRVPHTALPAAQRNKVVVRDQGDNEGVELLGAGDGMVLRSDDGRRWLLRVDDTGNLVVEPR